MLSKSSCMLVVYCLCTHQIHLKTSLKVVRKSKPFSKLPWKKIRHPHKGAQKTAVLYSRLFRCYYLVFLKPPLTVGTTERD